MTKAQTDLFFTYAELEAIEISLEYVLKLAKNHSLEHTDILTGTLEKVSGALAALDEMSEDNQKKTKPPTNTGSNTIQ